MNGNYCRECGGPTNEPGIGKCESSIHDVDGAQRVVAKIIRDLRRRRELRREWDRIAGDIQEEIRDVWCSYIREELVREGEARELFQKLIDEENHGVPQA